MTANNRLNSEERKQIRIRIIERDLDHFANLTTDLLKWFAAGTLTLNGAPLLAMLSSDKLISKISDTGVYFAVGVATSLIGNLLIAGSFAHFANLLTEKHWRGEAIQNDIYEDVIQDKSSLLRLRSGAVLLSLSVIAFLIGMVQFGSDLNAQQPPSTVSQGLKK